MDNEPQFYNEYEHFYRMTEKSTAFKCFCKTAFGEDFSQDGFSDIEQINRILDIIPKLYVRNEYHNVCMAVYNEWIFIQSCILLLFSGVNGYLLKYLYKKTKSELYGIDISADMMMQATKKNKEAAKQGKIHYKQVTVVI